MKLFRIVRNEYWDEYGQLVTTRWTVQEKRKFLVVGKPYSQFVEIIEEEFSIST